MILLSSTEFDHRYQARIHWPELDAAVQSWRNNILNLKLFVARFALGGVTFADPQPRLQWYVFHAVRHFTLSRQQETITATKKNGLSQRIWNHNARK